MMNAASESSYIFLYITYSPIQLTYSHDDNSCSTHHVPTTFKSHQGSFIVERDVVI